MVMVLRNSIWWLSCNAYDISHSKQKHALQCILYDQRGCGIFHFVVYDII